jgi:ketosteroid isomerase-like protein
MYDQVLFLENQAMERWRIGDPEGYLKLCTNDVVYFDPKLSRPITKLDGLREYLRTFGGKIHFERADFMSPKVDQVGNAALLTYNFRSTAISPLGTVIRQIIWNVTQIYFKQGEQWKIVHSHWSFAKQRLPDELDVTVSVPIKPIQYTGVMENLMKVETAAMNRWRKGDPWGFFDLCALNFTYFDPNTPHRIDGLQNIRAEVEKTAGNIKFDIMDFVEPQLRVQGEIAVLSYRMLATQISPEGSVLSKIPLNCSEVYLNRGGSWLLLHNHWSYIQGKRAF